MTYLDFEVLIDCTDITQDISFFHLVIVLLPQNPKVHTTGPRINENGATLN